MGTLKTTGLAMGKRDAHYPESDGKPMAETDLHWDETVELTLRLKARYAADPRVYIASDLFIYFEEGNPRAAVAPDVFVVFGVPKGQRRIYKLWEEGAVPAAVIEVTSRKTRREDLRVKMATYARLGVGEYFLYDPEAEYLRPPLQGHRLVGGTWQAIAALDAEGTLASAALGLDLRLEAGLLELYDAASGDRLPRLAEQKAAAEAAEAELERLRAELAELRGEAT
jgi:Uma2 family endonuclease